MLVGLALQMAGALAIERRERTGLTPEPGGLPVKREKKGKNGKTCKTGERYREWCHVVRFRGKGPLVGEYRNPFTPTFGIVPPFMAGRTYIIDDILRALDRGPGDPNLSTIFIGARGTGKTALLSYLSSEAASHGWIAVSVAAAPGMLEDIYERTKEAAAEFIDQSDSPRLKGISVAQLFGAEWETPAREPENWRTRMNRLFKSLEKYDIGLLITIDEIRVTLDEMVAFASTYQLFVREGKRVGLLMAGLPQQVSALLRNESVSFLRRCVQHHLDSVADQEVADALRRTVESEGRTVETPELRRMVEAIGGFPFMMQLVGYRVWDQSPCEREISEEDVERGIELAHSDMEQRVLEPTYRELSNQDVQFLEAMLPDGGGVSSISNVAERMGVSSNYASKYRARLIEQGVIGERGRGRIGFDMPFFREYVGKMRTA